MIEHIGTVIDRVMKKMSGEDGVSNTTREGVGMSKVKDGSESETVEAKAVEPRLERHEFTSSQKCQLTNTEILAQGEAMAGAAKDSAEAENELASVKKQFQARIDAADCAMQKAANLIRDKFEYRNVKCERIYDYNAGTVTERRLDTGDQFNKREMTEDEKQVRLKLETDDGRKV